VRADMQAAQRMHALQDAGRHCWRQRALLRRPPGRRQAAPGVHAAMAAMMPRERLRCPGARTLVLGEPQDLLRCLQRALNANLVHLQRHLRADARLCPHLELQSCQDSGEAITKGGRGRWPSRTARAPRGRGARRRAATRQDFPGSHTVSGSLVISSHTAKAPQQTHHGQGAVSRSRVCRPVSVCAANR